MKRFVISLLLLLTLTVGGFWNHHILSQLTDSLTQRLTLAQSAADRSDWDTARAITQKAQSDWAAKDGYLYIVLFHGSADAVNANFAAVLALLEGEASPDYQAANQQLILSLRHLSQAEALNWQNLL